jgi:hypothetical protein
VGVADVLAVISCVFAEASNNDTADQREAPPAVAQLLAALPAALWAAAKAVTEGAEGAQGDGRDIVEGMGTVLAGRPAALTGVLRLAEEELRGGKEAGVAIRAHTLFLQ